MLSSTLYLSDQDRAARAYGVVMQCIGQRGRVTAGELTDALAADLSLGRDDAASLLGRILYVLEGALLVVRQGPNHDELVAAGFDGRADTESRGVGWFLSSFEGTSRQDVVAAIAYLEASLRGPTGTTKTSGTHGAYVASTPTEPSEPTTPYAVHLVFYATDRALREPTSVGDFGGDRSKANVVSYGLCEVSIPRDHRMGRLESPAIWKFEFRSKPEKHVQILTRTPLTEDDFVARAASSDKGEGALLFVHGYNVTFDDAVRRAAQLSYDTTFAGPTVCYSWPSRGRVDAYTVDEAANEWSELKFTEFLKMMLRSFPSVNVIAHSLGNRLLSRALEALSLSLPPSPKVSKVVFAAPDVDRDTFEARATSVTQTCKHATLYTSDTDTALRASMTVHGATRAGLTLGNPVVVHGIDTVDVTAVNSDFMGHGYYAGNDSVISDLFYVLQGVAVPRFRLSELRIKSGAYWRFNP